MLHQYGLNVIHSVDKLPSSVFPLLWHQISCDFWNICTVAATGSVGNLFGVIDGLYVLKVFLQVRCSLMQVSRKPIHWFPHLMFLKS